MSEVNRLRQDCYEGLDRLWFCNPDVVMVARHWIEQTEDTARLAEYLETRLLRLERAVGTANHLAFREVVAHFHDREIFNSFVEAPSTIGALFKGLFDAAWARQTDAPACLYAAASFLSLPDVAMSVDVVAEMQILVGRSLGSLDAVKSAAEFLEACLELESADYQTRKRLAQKLDTELCRRLMSNTCAMFVSTLAVTISCLNRSADAVLMLEAYVGLDPEDYSSPAILSAKLEALRGQLTADHSAIIATHLAAELRFVSRDLDAVLMLEAYARLEEADYQSSALLSAKLRGTLADDNSANFAIALANALRFVDRDLDAVHVLEAYARLEEADYQSSALLSAKLRGTLTNNNSANFAIALANALRFADRVLEAVLVLESYARLEEADYESPALLYAKLNMQLQLINGAAFANVLADSLVFANRTAHAALVLDLYTNDFEFLRSSSPQSQFNINNVGNIVRSRLGLLLPKKRSAGLVNDFVDWLRRTLDVLKVDAPNRVQVAANLREFRSFVIEYADRAVEEFRRRGEESEALAWRRYGLEWEAWLGQRVLLERMVEPRLLAKGGDGASLPFSVGWPLPSETRPSWEKRGDRWWEFCASNNAALDSLASVDFAHPEDCSTELAWESLDAARQSRLIELTRRRTSLIDLASSVGDGGLLFRASVGDKGEVYWSVWKSERGDMTFLAAQSDSRPRQAALLDRAIAVHDFWIRFAYLRANTREKSDQAANSLRRGRLAPPKHSSTRRFVSIIVKNRNVITKEISKCDSRLAEVFAAVVDAALRIEGELEKLSESDAWFQALVDELLAFADKPPSAALNAATRRYLEQISQVINLSPLAPHLNSNAQLVISADGPLASIPLAFLPVRGKPLWRQVGSTRATLSLMLDDLAEEVEAGEEMAEEETKSVLAGAWSQRQDGIRAGAAEFLHAVKEISESRGVRCDWLGDDPETTVDNICRSVHAKEVRRLVMALYGHGSLEKGGVEVGPNRQAFNGKGCRLELIEFLIFISCSIARSKSSGARDFEGFCVELARQRARAALAASWAINSFQAAHFAAEVIDQYLRLRAEQPVSGAALTEARLRSKAVAEARKNLLALRDKDGNELYLNTLAAFELWGLG